MNRQHPCPQFALQIIQILAIFSEKWIHCHYLLTDPRIFIFSSDVYVLIICERDDSRSANFQNLES